MFQAPLIAPRADWTPPDLNALPSWANAKRVGLDTETRDPDLKKLGPGVRRGGNSYLVGISFAIEDGPGGYLPIAHAGGGNLPKELVLKYLRDQAEVFTGDIVGANLPYDLDWLAQHGIVFRKARFFRDVQVAEPLIDELQMSYSLENIAKRHGLGGKDETLLQQAARAYGIHPKKDLWRLPAHLVAPYAEEDARLPLALLRRQERIIEEQDIWGVYDLESRVLPVLVKMRRRGVRVHEGRLAEIERWALQQETEALAQVKHLTGVSIAVGDVWKNDQLAPALEYIGVKLGKTADGRPSIDKELLASLDHDVARCLERARKTNKLRTTFAASVREHMVNGRIHATFNQLRMEKDNGDLAGAAFGRLSCVQPNLQQQPARDEFAKMWRSIYLPEEGMTWAALDYSQQEPRMTVHFAELCELPGAKEAGERYRTDPDADNHQMMADMANIQRKAAKEIFLGLCYGMGGAKLCRKLGLPTAWAVSHPKVRGLVDAESERGKQLLAMGGRKLEIAGPEGQQLLDAFDSKVPFVRLLARRTADVAKTRGYLMTLSGRRCRFPKTAEGKYDWTHKALNRLIQGSSADQTKTAMVELDKQGHFLQLQVHDEMDGSVHSPEEAEAMAEIMRTCVPLTVPSKVDVELGASWGESMS
ncbi:putative DNA polymerase I [Pseudomonas phage vB_PaeS_PAO1_Ab18]|uniref:DNA polymerase n=1 Tax=Pseudomonas phage vB_PaeS_PAO1_Ab18 TaxID=1548905 RepID=A0A0A1IWZ4_9CAUD|nr:putative DNA polymerase I [Pseudomonas phage vB_PaeS_PAO1_Ab18]CEF89657.1 putative DNA polymerase I [Pseudomonas phage vB_PaeS_PAO1_Ab18]